MSADIDNLKITNNRDKGRYEAWLGDQLALIDYVLDDGLVTFTHAEVPPALQGRGIAQKMARTALEEARQEGLAVRSFCSFVSWYISQHPEYQPLLCKKGRAGA